MRFIMWELIVGVGVPALGGIIVVTKYITTMKSKIRELSKHDESSVDTHDGFEERLRKIENNQIQTDIYLKLILTKLEIPYK